MTTLDLEKYKTQKKEEPGDHMTGEALLLYSISLLAVNR
jgi:hypothetical protein